MAQGLGKLKGKQTMKKDKHKNKGSKMKKGARVIAPKKAKHLEQAKLKKGLEKAVKMSIEQEVTLKTKSIEAKKFKVIESPATSTSDKKTVKPPKLK